MHFGLSETSRPTKDCGRVGCTEFLGAMPANVTNAHGRLLHQAVPGTSCALCGHIAPSTARPSITGRSPVDSRLRWQPSDGAKSGERGSKASL